jgi:hypothetical protein
LALFYQDDLVTPGSLPSLANSLKQIRHKSKSLMYPCFLPHLKHLLTTLEEYFGVLFALAITDFFAIVFKIKIKRKALIN